MIYLLQVTDCIIQENFHFISFHFFKEHLIEFIRNDSAKSRFIFRLKITRLILNNLDVKKRKDKAYLQEQL